MIYGWPDLLGMIGVVLILATYMLLQLEKLSATSFLYSATNGLGASLILVSLIYEFNLSAFTIEAFWLLISIYGIVRHFSRNRSKLAAKRNN
jgi:predicted membrane protein